MAEGEEINDFVDPAQEFVPSEVSLWGGGGSGGHGGTWGGPHLQWVLCGVGMGMGLGLGWVGGRTGIEMGVGGEVRVGGGLGLGLR